MATGKDCKESNITTLYTLLIESGTCDASAGLTFLVVGDVACVIVVGHNIALRQIKP